MNKCAIYEYAHNSKTKKVIVAILLTMTFLSCSNDNKKNSPLANDIFPQAETKNFILTYTEETKVKAIITSELNIDYTNQKFPYSEFPIGVDVIFYDELKRENYVTAKYGIIYPETNLVELRDSVMLTTYDKKILRVNTLFWDINEDWIFSEDNFTFTDKSKGSITKGVGIDFDKNFSILKAHKTTGVLPMKE